MSTIPPKKYPRLSQKWFRQNPVRIFVVAGVTVAFLWAGSALIIWPAYCDIAERGQFGDQFGAINALFSGLAFAGIVVSLFLQRRDLSLQRRDLKMQRVEMSMQREEMEKSRFEFEEQNFHDVFFNLLKQQRDILAQSTAKIKTLHETDLSIVGVKEVSGHLLFEDLRREARRINYALLAKPYVVWDAKMGMKANHKIIAGKEKDSNFSPFQIQWGCLASFACHLYFIDENRWKAAQGLDSLTLGKVAFEILLERYGHAISSYCRHFLGILDYLNERMEDERTSLKTTISKDEKEKEEARIHAKYIRYARFLMNQSSPPELSICFYFSLVVEQDISKLIKYGLLDEIFLDDLWGVQSNSLDGVTIKKRKHPLDVDFQAMTT